MAVRARSVTISNLIKEMALLLAPLGLDMQGLHVWAEKNTAADELSRVAQHGRLPLWMDASCITRSSPHLY